MGEIKMPTQNSPSVSSQQSQYEIPAELQEVNYFIITEFEFGNEMEIYIQYIYV